MNVATLNQYLSDLSSFLRSNESAKAAGELEYLCSKMRPLGDLKVKAFADFVEKAQNPPVATASRPRSTSRGSRVDAAKLEETRARIVSLYEQAIDPSTTLDQIERTIHELGEMDLSVAILKNIAESIGAATARRKADIVKSIRQKIIGRKGSFDRVHA